MASATCIRRCIRRCPDGVASWMRRFTAAAEKRKEGSEFIPRRPLLMLSSRTKPESRFFYDVTADEITREVHLPSLAGHRFIGSSQGFLISVDDKDAEIHATNPFTGAHLSLPSTCTLPNISGVMVSAEDENPITHYLYSPPNRTTSRHHEQIMLTPRFMHRWHLSKAIIASPLFDAVVLIDQGCDRRLTFAKLKNNHINSSSSSSGNSWTALETSPLFKFEDIIFHKGRLHAVNLQGTLAVFDLEDPLALPLVSSEGPFAEEYLMTCYLVESPDGEDLFLVFRDSVHPTTIMTTDIRVFKLENNSNCFKWNRVEHIGDVALFIGANHSVALPASTNKLQPNSVYFTNHSYLNITTSDTGVFNLQDASVQFYSVEKGQHQFNQQPTVWYLPMLP